MQIKAQNYKTKAGDINFFLYKKVDWKNRMPTSKEERRERKEGR